MFHFYRLLCLFVCSFVAMLSLYPLFFFLPVFLSSNRGSPGLCQPPRENDYGFEPWTTWAMPTPEGKRLNSLSGGPGVCSIPAQGV